MSAAAKKQHSNVVILHPAKPDPIFARIAAWQEAEKAHHDAISARSLVENALSKKFPSSDTELDWRDVTDSEASITAGHTTIRTFAQINDYIDGDMGGLFNLYKGVKTVTRQLSATARARKKELRRQLREARIQLKALQDKHGWTAAEALYEASEDQASRALRKLCDTKPTTIAGLAAMLCALQERMEEGASVDEFYDGRTNNLFATLAAASADIAHKAGTGR